MQEIRLPVGAEELRSYFASVSAERPEDPHWTNGIMMCDWWLRLASAASTGQVEIDSFLKRLTEEKDAGAGWLDLGMRFSN
jgi:hypothetical protein